MILHRWLITLAYAAVIFFLSSRTWGGTGLFPYADKAIHFCIYAGLAVLCAWSLAAAARLNRRDVFLAAVGIATLYGVSDELHQLFVPGRDCDLYDALTDAVGALAGAAVAVRFLRRAHLEEVS